MTKLARFFIPRIEYILFAALFWGIAASGPKILNFDGDLPRHLLTGNLILQTHRVPLTDTFSFRTVGYPSYPHEWLAQVILATIYDLMGLSGVVILTALIITAVWAIVYSQAFSRSTSLFSALLCTGLGIGASLIHVLPRPHIFTYLLIAIWILVLEKIQKEDSRLWWTLPLIMLVWVNLHGMFVFGIMIWGIYLAGAILDDSSLKWLFSDAGKSMLLGGAFSLITTLISPSGIHIWGAIASLGSNAYITAHIPEYQSANFHLPETWPFVFLLILILFSLARSTNKIPWRHTLLLITFAGLALYSSRMIPLFAIIAAPIAAGTLAGWARSDFPRNMVWTLEENISKINSTSNGSIWIFIVILAAIALSARGIPIDAEKKGNVFDKQFFPVEAVEWLNSHPQRGHMFNEFDWGGYLLLELEPRQQIFMDGHTHIYGEALTREYEQVITLKGDWENILEKYQVEWAILRTGAAVASALEANHWESIYQDGTAVILRKGQ